MITQKENKHIEIIIKVVIGAIERILVILLLLIIITVLLTLSPIALFLFSTGSLFEAFGRIKRIKFKRRKSKCSWCHEKLNIKLMRSQPEADLDCLCPECYDVIEKSLEVLRKKNEEKRNKRSVVCDPHSTLTKGKTFPNDAIWITVEEEKNDKNAGNN